jgi:16S rRNA (cytosine967-C5)-methyltransferase
MELWVVVDFSVFQFHFSTPMIVTPARQIAFDILQHVEAEGAYASDLLHTALDARVKSVDAALATELTMGVLRWRRLLDFLLERNLKKSMERLDLPVAIALRMGLYQLRFLDKIPASAAINESVELVKKARKTSAASLVNAVLRRIAADAKSPAEKFITPDLPPADRLGILHSHPTWMVDRWISRIGEPRTIELLQANNQTPRLTCALHDANARGDVIADLKKAGLRIEPGVLLKNAFAVSGGSPARTEAFRAGKISIQDEASQAVPLLLGVRSGDRVLDLCAAPGGKTSALIRAAGSQGIVVAADRHAHRLRAMCAQFERLGLGGVECVELDATQPLPFREKFDRILVDAPCSGTGTLARHPEIRWRLRPEQLKEFHALQSGMLRMAFAHLASAGRLVYSTCSIEDEENEDVVNDVQMNRMGIQRLPREIPMRELAEHVEAGVDVATLFARDGYFRASTPIHRTDGFFASIFTTA